MGLWIRFWHQSRCASGHNDEESSYEWFDEDSPDDHLKEEADERVPHWRKMAERGYGYGFERVTELPEDVRKKLIKSFERRKAYADKMLDILLATPVKSRLERI